MIIKRWILLSILVLFFSSGYAAVVIIIDEGLSEGRPIAIVPFNWKGSEIQPPQDIADIISLDLLRSGVFKPIKRANFQATPTTSSKINFHNWRLIKAENLIVGEIIQTAKDKYSIEVMLYDVYRQKMLVQKVYPNVGKNSMRMQIHRVADDLYKELTGLQGAFATRLAYVLHKPGSKKYKLIVSEYDGQNSQEVLSSTAPILSPSWSRDGIHIAYALQKGLRWEVVIQNLATTERKILSKIHPGLKGATAISAPSWSPDSKRLTFAMSKNFNKDIYIVGFKDGYFRRLTTHYGIDTEPVWMPDGKSIVFTSSRGGSPQLYQTSINGKGKAKRLTFEGNYNARASISPDGRNIAFVHGRKNAYSIALLEVKRGIFNILAEASGSLYESPSFAPNSQMIVYTAGRTGGRFTPLAVVSIDGRANYSVEETIKSDIQEPSWSNYISK